MPSRFFFIVIFVQIASIPEFQVEKNSKKPRNPICPVFWVKTVGWLGKYAALSLNTKQPDVHYKDNLLLTLYYRLQVSPQRHTRADLSQQSHFAEWFLSAALDFSHIFMAMSEFTASQKWNLLPAMLILHLGTGLSASVGDHCQIYCKLSVLLKALSCAEGTWSRRQRAEPPDVS